MPSAPSFRGCPCFGGWALLGTEESFSLLLGPQVKSGEGQKEEAEDPLAQVVSGLGLGELQMPVRVTARSR